MKMECGRFGIYCVCGGRIRQWDSIPCFVLFRWVMSEKVCKTLLRPSFLTALRQGDPPDTIGASLHLSKEPHFSAFSSRAGASAVFRFLPSPLHPLRVNRWTIG